MKFLSKFRGRKAMKTSKHLVQRYGLLTCLLTLLTGAAFATGTGGGTSQFGDMLTTITGWATGDLGKLLAVSAFLIGIGMGIVRQSIIAIALGIGFALCLAYGPEIITGIFTFAL